MWRRSAPAGPRDGESSASKAFTFRLSAWSPFYREADFAPTGRGRYQSDFQ